MKKSILINENIFLTAGKLLPAPLDESFIKQELEKLEYSKEYLHKRFIKNLEKDISFESISLDAITEILDACFYQVEYIENKLFFVLTEEVEDIVAYAINDESFIYVFYDKQRKIKDIYIEFYLETQEEKEKVLQFFKKISQFHKFYLIDWGNFIISNLGDEKGNVSFLDKNIKRYEDKYKIFNKKIFRHNFSIKGGEQRFGLIFVLFICIGNAWRAIKSFDLGEGLTIIFSILLPSLLLASLLFYGFCKEIKVTPKKIRITRMKKIEEYSWSDINYFKMGVAIISLNVRVQSKKGTKNIPIGLRFFSDDDALEIIELIRTHVKPKYPEKAGDYGEKFLARFDNKAYFPKPSKKFSFDTDKILNYASAMSNKQIGLLRKDKILRKLKLKTYSPADLFKKQFGGLEGLHFGLNTRSFTEYFSFISYNKKEKESTSFTGYEDIVGESLTYVGVAYNGKFGIYISKSGKLFCLYRNFLLFYGNNYYEGLDNLLLGKLPLKTYNLISDNGVNIFDYISEKWEPIYDFELASKGIKDEIIPGGESLIEHRIFPLFTDQRGEQFLIYDFDEKSFVRIYKEQGKEEVEIKKLQNIETIKDYLWPYRIDMKAIIPREYIPNIIQELNEVFNFKLSQEDIHHILEDSSANNIYSFPNKELDKKNFFIVDSRNKDWNLLFICVSLIKYDNVESIIGKYTIQSREKYGGAYENFENFFNSFPGTFFKTISTVGFIDEYFKEKPEKKEEGFVQYSLTFDYKLLPELALDICSILGIGVDLDYLLKVNNNDAILGIHCLGIFPNKETGEFVLFDCQNTDNLYGMVIKCRKNMGKLIGKRLIEWENERRKTKNPYIEYTSIKNELNKKESLLEKIKQDYKIDETFILINNPEIQFQHTNSISHKLKRFLRDKGIVKLGN